MADIVLFWYRSHAVHVFVFCIFGAMLIERVYGVIRHRRADVRSMATSVISGISFMAAKHVVAKAAMVALSLFVYERFALTHLDLGNPWLWLGVFVMRDFIYYWVHRAEHRCRVLWASHMVHHSPESIGFTTAVRVPWMEAIYKPWLGLWVPLIGFNPLAFVALDILAATYAQLYHTEFGKRRTWFDWVLVTPSSHRVHHGSNDLYLDKNYGAVFIVWDRLFGTYQAETEPVRYGLIGGSRVLTPKDALLGGYPKLAAAIDRIPSKRAKLRYLVAPPA
jgi:sterol desaturase/sphingolipid hydroxylase (fatty acid hydroxylase superfamily)